MTAICSFVCLIWFCGIPGSFVRSQIWLFFIRFIAFHHEPNSSCALMGRCSSVFSVRKSHCCQICGLLRSQRTAPRGTSEKLVQIPASEIEPSLGGEIISQHNMSNQRQSDSVLVEGKMCPLDIKLQVRECSMLGLAWLGCCLDACAPCVTLESPYDRCSSLMSLKRIQVFFLSFSHKANHAPYILHMAAFYSLGTNGRAHCSACEVKFPLDEHVNDRTQPLT